MPSKKLFVPGYRYKTLFFLFALSLLITTSGHGADRNATPAIIPKPANMEVIGGAFRLTPQTRIYVLSNDDGARSVGEYLSKLISGALGRNVPAIINPHGARNRSAIFLSLQAPQTLGPEGYQLIVTPYNIRILAVKTAGLFYGVQTLRQLLPPEVESDAAAKRPIDIPCLEIQDQPRYSWRGLMLDCSRTFLPIAYLRSTIDRMALYKLNVLHLHLTDDQGWRLEIRKYPELTTVGDHYAARFGGTGGFYTQREMRDLIAYAGERNVTIVPEIEMPGHSTEVLATYPDLACDLPEPRKFEVHPFWEGIIGLTQPLCAGNDKLYAMYQDILAEVIDLFPSPYIHVGGDEVPKDAWKTCPRCQARIKAEELKDEEELQSYFMRRMEKAVEAKGRRLVGWDEILEGGLAPGAIVMSWRGTKGGVAAAQLGHDVVMTPNPYTYFDYTYHTTPTEKVYAYDPAATEFTPALAQHILGVQASMWTHIAVTEGGIDYQIYPRLLALAEVAWTPQRLREWNDFSSRATVHFRRLQSLNIKYCDVSESGKKVGAWQASDLKGETPRQFTWEATPFVPNSGEVQVQVRHDDGEKLTYIRSLVLLKDGKEISQAVFPGPLDKTNDVNIGWLAAGERQAGSRYTVRVTLQGSKDGGDPGSVWIMEPRLSQGEVVPCAHRKQLSARSNFSLDNSRVNDYIEPMSTKLKDEIKQGKPFESLEAEVFLNLVRTADALSRGVEDILKLAGLSHAQYNVLRILRGAGEQGLCCREVAERMITRDPDITRLLDRLERRDLLARSRDSKDRRVITVRITTGGQKLLKDLDGPMSEYNRKLLSHMDKSDLRKLVELLEVAREP